MLKNTSKHVIAALALASVSTVALADGGSMASRASEKISIGTLSIVTSPTVSLVGMSVNPTEPLAGSVLGITGSVYLVTGIVQGAGDVVEVLISGVGSAAKFSVKIAGKAINTVGLSVGTTIRVVSEATGTLLVVSGKVLAFIPNTVGEALLSQSRLPNN
jgi:hypothetical protein